MKIVQPPAGYRGFNLLGRKFNRLKVVSFGGYRVWSTNTVPVPLWVCRCDCGEMVTVKSSAILSGETKSCGCYKREIDKTRQNTVTHGMARKGRVHFLYRRYRAIISRCTDSNVKSYRNYGQAGVRVCEGFRDFQVFHDAVMPTWYEGGTIDRRNNNGHYSCGACRECRHNRWRMNLRWVTQKQQCRNKRNNIWLKWKGQKKLLIEWAEEYGIQYATLYWRIVKQKWAAKEAFGRPVR